MRFYVFGEINVNFCLFHFCQTTWRKLQQLGLIKLYNNNPEFSLFCRMVNALAFLPDAHVSQGLEILQQSAPEEALPFLH